MLNLNFSAADFHEIRTGIAPGARGLDLTTGRGEGSRPEGSPEKEKPLIFRVFTDGSCFNNGKKNSTGGIGIHFPDQQLEDISAPYYGKGPYEIPGKVTNQRAELMAIYQALLLMNDYVDGLSVPNGPPPVHLHVYTDSEYCINSLTNWCYAWRDNNWRTAKGKPAKNRDIIEPLLALMKRRRVLFFHAEAHTERDDERSRGNARADFLATQATKRQQQLVRK